MRLSIKKVNQAARGGSYVVIYDALMQLTDSGQVEISVESVEPAETDGGLVDAAAEAIRQGAQHVLHPAGRGARITVQRLVINAIDFKPSRFLLFTAQEVERLTRDRGER